MKHPALIALAALMALASALPAGAEESIYRCSDGTTVTFQWTNCAPDQQEKVVLSAATAPAPAQTASEPSGKSDQSSPGGASQITRASWRAQVRSPAPYVGISDDAVLNMRGWGRPGKIVRKRGEHAWLEHWQYTSPSGEARHLHFANGKLVAINLEPAPYVVQLANAPDAGQGSQ